MTRTRYCYTRTMSTMSSFGLLERARDELFQQKNYDNAIKHLTETLERPQTSKVQNYEARLLRGVSSLQKGDNTNAINDFQSILDNYNASCKYAKMGLAEIALQNKDYDTALLHVLSVLQVDSKYHRARLILSKILLEQYSQFELSASHTNTAIAKSLESFTYQKEFNLASEIENDAYFHIDDNIDKYSISDTLMNCTSILRKLNYDYYERNSLFSRLMKDNEKSESIPILDINEKTNKVNIKIPKNQILDSESNFKPENITNDYIYISPEIYRHSDSMFANSPTMTAAKNLEQIVEFSEKVSNQNNIVVLVSENETAKSIPLTEDITVRSIDSPDPQRRWIGIASALENYYWKFKPEYQLKKYIKMPSDWSVFYEREFLRTESRIPEEMYYYTAALNDSVCSNCNHSISGILACNYAYGSKTEYHTCSSCKETFYSPKFSSINERKYVEYPLMEKVYQRVWNSSGVVVLGDLNCAEPWWSLVKVAALKNIPILFFHSKIPMLNSNQSNMYAVSTPMEQSFSHLVKELEYLKYKE